MRAISLWQPWATLIAIGAKQYETRSWAIGYRGEIAIHAAKSKEGLEFAYSTLPYVEALYAAGYKVVERLPLGAVLCVAKIVDCIRTEQIRDQLSPREKAFGNYADGRYAWRLANVRLLATPIPARGSQGIWDWKIPGEAAWIS